jgi:hypothetical protein
VWIPFVVVEKPTLLSPSQNKRALHKVRRSFYSSSAGPLIRSRSMTQTNIDSVENIADRTRHNSGKLNSILRKPPSQSSILKSPDRNSSFLLSQLKGSPTPQKAGFKTPGKVTPRKVVTESPSTNTRSKSPFVSKGFPKALFQESPSCRGRRSKIVRHSPKLPSSGGKEDGRNSQFSKTPKKSTCELVTGSHSQNTRSKSLTTPTRKSVRAILFGKSPEAKAGEEKKLRKDQKTPSKSSLRARRSILSNTPVKGEKAINADESAGTEKNLTGKVADDEGNAGDTAKTSVNDGLKDDNKSPDKSGTPSPKIQRKIRTPSSLNHWQRRKRGRDESMQSPKLLTRIDTKETQNRCSREIEVDNDIIFASLSQEEGHVSCRKRGLNIMEDESVIFSPNKRKRTVQHSDQGTFRTSYTLINKITHENNSLLNSFASGNSEGFDTTDLTDSQCSYRMSQASTSSVDFSVNNDEVFWLQNQSQDKGAVSEHDTNTANTCTSPVFQSGKKTRKMKLSDVEGNSGQKASPEKKYSPNVSARSLLHLMHSPLLNSDKVEKSPKVNKNAAIVGQQRPRSRRSLNLQM